MPFSSLRCQLSFLSSNCHHSTLHTHNTLHYYNFTSTLPPPKVNTTTHHTKWVSKPVRFPRSRGRHRAPPSPPRPLQPIEPAHDKDIWLRAADYRTLRLRDFSDGSTSCLRSVVALRQRVARRPIFSASQVYLTTHMADASQQATLRRVPTFSRYVPFARHSSSSGDPENLS